MLCALTACEASEIDSGSTLADTSGNCLDRLLRRANPHVRR